LAVSGLRLHYADRVELAPSTLLQMIGEFNDQIPFFHETRPTRVINPTWL
jgi:hypothetical protein